MLTSCGSRSDWAKTRASASAAPVSLAEPLSKLSLRLTRWPWAAAGRRGAPCGSVRRWLRARGAGLRGRSDSGVDEGEAAGGARPSACPAPPVHRRLPRPPRRGTRRRKRRHSPRPCAARISCAPAAAGSAAAAQINRESRSLPITSPRAPGRPRTLAPCPRDRQGHCRTRGELATARTARVSSPHDPDPHHPQCRCAPGGNGGAIRDGGDGRPARPLAQLQLASARSAATRSRRAIAEIRRDGESYLLKDISTNGTFLNDGAERMPSEHRLAPGDLSGSAAMRSRLARGGSAEPEPSRPAEHLPPRPIRSAPASRRAPPPVPTMSR